MTLNGATRIKPISPGPDQVHLRLLATTDLHAHLLPFDYYTAQPNPGFGLARLAQVIAHARAAAPNTLLFDNGDTLQGTPLAETIMSDILPSGAPNPIISVMNALGFDAATVGNHDFDFGIDYLTASLATAAFPWVLANAHFPDGQSFLPPRRILHRRVLDGAGRPHDLRIGVTGAAPPQVAIWSKPLLEGVLSFGDIVCSVAEQAQALRAEGADLVVALCHSGLGHPQAMPGAENVALQVAAQCGVDVVVAGHTHGVAACRDVENGVPVVQAASSGTNLGLVDLLLAPDTAEDPARQTTQESGWTVDIAQIATPSLSDGDVRVVPGLRQLVRPLVALREEVTRAHRSTRTKVELPLGATAVPIHTYFSTISPCSATQLIADAQCAAAAPLLAARPDLADLPVLSAAAPFRAGGQGGPSNYTDIPDGELKLRHAADLYVYPNTLNVVRIKGSDVRSWLENCASIYRRIDPEAPTPQKLIDHSFAPYKFDRITGLRYKIDVSQPPRTDSEGVVINPDASRVQDLRLACGDPVHDEDEVLVITNSYRAAGGGHIVPPDGFEPVLTSSHSVRDAIANYISASTDRVDPVVDPTFSFVPLGGTRVLFETGAGALDHADRLEELGLRQAANTPQTSGFVALSMVL